MFSTFSNGLSLNVHPLKGVILCLCVCFGLSERQTFLIEFLENGIIKAQELLSLRKTLLARTES